MEQYGFIIDNRKCIGCHACTVACKSEHNVPLGVNRTWVKYIEEDVFPNTTRSFSVMRCNHCAKPPCVEICPVAALYKRDDGIVDFDNNRCIGCKACTQACPYDALYIDPISNTAAKCNYCAHRVDTGMEPACVVVCPEHAIIAGDMSNPESEIAQLLRNQEIKVRKPEKNTAPQLFYINANTNSLEPTSSSRNDYLWSSQERGVGIKKDVVPESYQPENQPARRVYDAPDKGILWGWEVVGYLNTKALAAGLGLLVALLYFFGFEMSTDFILKMMSVSLLFMILTAALLIKDLRQPKRFLYIVFRPQFKSWLSRGTYILLSYSLLLTLTIISCFLSANAMMTILMALIIPTSILTAIYTAFLFAQAKGRAFWNNSLSAPFMLIHAVVLGLIVLSFYPQSTLLEQYRLMPLLHIVNLLITWLLFKGTDVCESKLAASIIQTQYRFHWFVLIVLVGNVIPIVLAFCGLGTWALVLSSIMVVTGVITTGYLFIKTPQLIPLS